MAQQDDATAAAVEDIRGDAAAREERAAAARAQLAAAALPVANLNAALPHLRRPFSSAAIRFKVQTVFPKGKTEGCVIVAYIDARLVIERLNAIVGGEWEAHYAAVASNDTLLRCDLTVFERTRCDVGESSKKMSKDLISDALKRAAVQFGVGVSVYALPQVTWYAKDKAVELKERGPEGKKTLVLTDAGHARLHTGYVRWLSETAERAFGPVLDHGDVLPEVIDPEADDPLEGEGSFAPAPAALLEDDVALELRDRITAAYGQIAHVDGARAKFPPATFNEWLENAMRHSHAELERLLEHVQKRRDELLGAEG